MVETRKSYEDPVLSSALVCRAFLPSMVARKAGVLVSVQSSFAHGAFAGATMQVAASFALKGLAQALAADVRGTGVEVQEVLVSWENLTPIQDSTSAGDPEGAAETIVAAIRNRKAFTIHGWSWVTTGSSLISTLSIWFSQVLGRKQVLKRHEQRAQPRAKASTPEPARHKPQEDPEGVKSWIMQGSPQKQPRKSIGQPAVTPLATPSTATPGESKAASANASKKEGSHVSPSSSADKPGIAKAGLGIMLSEEHNGLQIVVIEQGSPADDSKEINRGDVVTAVNHRDVRGSSCDDVLEMMQGAPGTSVILTIKSGGPTPAERKVRLFRGTAKDSAWINKAQGEEKIKKAKAKC
mmetsp:Transcript_26914/g.42062  ORF Transcript_26914/g.42062 Transcript_26914/m.42062 type:complete len:353 (+) Transcript_26914:182-1240(+)